MVIFESEDELRRQLRKHDDLVEECVQGHLSFWVLGFLRKVQ